MESGSGQVIPLSGKPDSRTVPCKRDGLFADLSKSVIWETGPMLQPSIVASEAQQGWVTAIAPLPSTQSVANGSRTTAVKGVKRLKPLSRVLSSPGICVIVSVTRKEEAQENSARELSALPDMKTDGTIRINR